MSEFSTLAGPFVSLHLGDLGVLKMTPAAAAVMQRRYVGLQAGNLPAGEFFSAIGPVLHSSNSALRESSTNTIGQ